jgi:lipooligosaccharide transport system permease protein
LFSGTFFPISQLPSWLQVVAWISPLWHGVVLCRAATTGAWPPGGVLGALAHLLILLAWIGLGAMWGFRTFTRRLVS